jgi:hypothetical protein
MNPTDFHIPRVGVDRLLSSLQCVLEVLAIEDLPNDRMEERFSDIYGVLEGVVRSHMSDIPRELIFEDRSSVYLAS